MSSSKQEKQSYDFVVVGARCAGASVAMLLARAGARVLVIDRQEYGSDRLSTHALMRAGVLQLGKWGLIPKLVAAGTPEVRRTTFFYGDEVVPVDIKPEGGVDFLMAPRRTVLDRILVDAAREAGAEVRHGVTLTDLVRGKWGRVTGVALRDAEGNDYQIEAGMVIGADGRQSRVAGLTGAQIYRQGRYSGASVFGYFADVPTDGYQWYFAEGSAAGAIPTNDGMSCVFASVPADRFDAVFRGDMETGFRAILAANSPELAGRAAAGRIEGRLKAFTGNPGYFRQSFGNGWALVGDAGYFKDPVTAHGISDALRDAELLATALTGGSVNSLALYQAQRDSLSSDLFEVTDAIASYEWDMQSVQEMHHSLSKSMRAECRMLAEAGGEVRLAA